MDKKQIAQIASQLSTKEDLLALLNRIKLDKTIEEGVDASKFRPFTMKQINYYCNPNHIFHRYHEFQIKKKSGDFRCITAPRTHSFRMLLQAVYELLKALYTPSAYAMGFTEGRSIVSNASVHKGQNYVFNIDLKDFFPSVEQARVWKRLQLQPFNFPIPIASIIAGLCAMRETRKDEEGKEYFVYVLPQGAPTSPIITNMICDTLDRRLAGLARRFGLNYTRYADDITFSSMHNVYSEKVEFRKELSRIIEGQGFKVNHNKTRLQKLGSRQEVTGIIVSRMLNVTQKYVRDIRNLLYIWDRYGMIVAMSKFLPKYKAEKGHVKKGNPDLMNVIEGKLLYLKMVKGETDSVYLRLNNKYQTLVARDSSAQRTNTFGISYIDTKNIQEFEHTNSTSISFIHQKDGRRYASFLLGGIKQTANIQKNVKVENEQNKEKLAISNCRNPQGEQFWIIHYANKVTVPPPYPINIDKLNDDLDTLLLNM